MPVMVAEVVFVVVVEAVGHPLPLPETLPNLGDREGGAVPEGVRVKSCELEDMGVRVGREEGDTLALALEEVEEKLV